VPAPTITPSVVHRSHQLSRLEIAAALLYSIVLIVLVAIEPDILQAPFESTRAVVVSFGGALLAVVALGVMIRIGIPPIVRLLVVGIPVVLVSWWLLEPFFVDDVVEEKFSTSIAAEQRRASGPSTVPSTVPSTGQDSAAAPATPTTPTTSPAPAGPLLLGSGKFVGLAGHDGTGDAGIFRLPDGSIVVRLENFDIDNGPDLELYLVPGSEAYSPRSGALHFGALKGNVGNQTYDVPRDFNVSPGPWTVLVWCKAFTVEFVGASLTVT
jgi:hypothetical protein